MVATEWQQVLDPIEALIARWEARGNSVVVVLPAWRANDGLTDGWDKVLAALRIVTSRAALPDDEMATLAMVAERLKAAIRNR